MTKKNKIAQNLTVFCLVLFIVTGAISFLIASSGGPEALGMIGPMMLAGAIHLFAGPIAIFHAYKNYSFSKSIYIFSYFTFFNIITLVVSRGEAILYCLIFLLFTIVPILFSTIKNIIKRSPR